VVKETKVYPLDETFTFDRIDVPPNASSLDLDDVLLLAPVTPSKIVCVGRNYLEHAAELGNKMPD